jgi:hypothetical protein
MRPRRPVVASRPGVVQTKAVQFQEDDATTRILDCERIHRALELVGGGRNLYEATTHRFEGPVAPPGTAEFDEPAFLYLVEHEFVDVPNELRNAIDKFRHLEGDAERTRVELSGLYRRLKTLAVQLRKADKDLEGAMNLLKSKNQKWEERTRRDALAQEIDGLTMKRRRMESDLEKAGTLFKELLDRIYGNQALREVYWYQGMPVRVTKYGRFLLEFLGEMNPDHFRGRTLAEIIEVGHSLA